MVNFLLKFFLLLSVNFLLLKQQNFYSQERTNYNFYNNYFFSIPNSTDNLVFNTSKKPKLASSREEKVLVTALFLKPNDELDRELFTINLSEYKNGNSYGYSIDFLTKNYVMKYKNQLDEELIKYTFSDPRYISNNYFESSYFFADLDGYNLHDKYNFYSITLSPDRKSAIIFKGIKIDERFPKEYIIDILNSFDRYKNVEHVDMSKFKWFIE